ncbi:Extracellular esterase EstB precursor [Pigmentiphaga humi]|uniref:Extracellular esterase EstB n=1 Tax=Pigmentiphaga humi TaxID=2478468 RepID=A0A3P4B2F7_9BURK|nr:alpha/beta fold hydrolase [Pigmentiphaga humi]VCU69828.1 Extracellular esterase EstB precursor [Pigmentiphaga humi]
MMAWAMRRFTLGVAALVGLTAWALTAWLPWPAALLAALALAVLNHALIVASGFLLAKRCADRAGTPAPRGWLAAIPAEALLSMRNMYLDMPWRQRWTTRQPPRTRGAVLLVHGYGCNRGVWRDLDTWLAGRGWAVGAVDLEPPRASIDAFGPQVAAAAAALARQTGHAQVAVIAHSMGGLAARAALRSMPEAPIRHVITLGTPHGGTWHACLGRGVCATEMAPDSAWLTTLCGAEGPALAARFTCVASHHDNIVSPASRAVLPGASSVRLFTRVGHMAMLHAPPVRAFLAERLEQLYAAPGDAA